MAPVIRIFALVILALLLGGCVTYSGVDSSVNDVRQALRRSVADGRMPVAVIGNPFAGASAKLEGLAAAALERHMDWLKAEFYIAAAGAPGDKILFVIDPVRVRHTRDICADPASVPFERLGAIMRIGAVYCADRVISEVWASLDRPASADDAVLAEVIDGLAWRVIPWVTKDQEEKRRTEVDS
jgi:predicted small secreted protein